MKVRFTPSARAEFLAVIGYLHAQNPSAARTFRDKVERQTPAAIWIVAVWHGAQLPEPPR